jgi:hypothetical protein
VPDLVVADGDGQRLPLPDQDDQLTSTGDGGVNEVPLQHGKVLGGQGDYHGGEF